MAYVDREKLIEVIRYKYKPVRPTGSLADVFCNLIEQTIKEQPTADVVEVVRCKECIHNADNGGDCDRVLIHTHRNLITETNEYQYFKLNCCEYGTPKERGADE